MVFALLVGNVALQDALQHIPHTGRGLHCPLKLAAVTCDLFGVHFVFVRELTDQQEHAIGMGTAQRPARELRHVVIVGVQLDHDVRQAVAIQVDQVHAHDCPGVCIGSRCAEFEPAPNATDGRTVRNGFRRYLPMNTSTKLHFSRPIARIPGLGNDARTSGNYGLEKLSDLFLDCQNPTTHAHKQTSGNLTRE